MTLPELLSQRSWQTEFGMALLASGFLYLVCRKRDEFSLHALQNIAATILVAGANVLAAVLFVDDINAGAQALYAGLGVPHLPARFWEDVPLWAVCLIGIAAKDFVDYWSHRLMHTRWGWPTHAAHHSDTHVNAFTAYRVHFLEQILMMLGYITVLTWLQMPQAIPAVVVFSSLHNLYVHMDLPFHHGPLRYLIASPVFHRWHHADVPEAYGKNLANVFPLFDLIFGTYLDAGRCTAPMGALKSGVEDKDPVAIYLYPFQEWGRMGREALSGHDAEDAPGPLVPANSLLPAE